MADHSIPEERTEMPTDRRMGQLRGEGAIFCSIEIVQVTTLLTAFYGLGYLWPILIERFQIVFRTVFTAIGDPEPITAQWAYHGFILVLYMFAGPLFFFVLSIAVVASLTVMLQTKWNVKNKWIKR